MDLYRRNRIRNYFFVTLLTISLFVSCRSSKTVIEEKKERTEIVTKTNPYKVTASDTLIVNNKGIINPVKLKLGIKNCFDGKISIKDNKITAVIENKDTIINSRIVKEKEYKEKPVFIKPKPTLWNRFKDKALIYSLMINAIVVVVFVVKVIYKTSFAGIFIK